MSTEKFEHVLEVYIQGSIHAVWEEITKRGSVQRPVLDTVLVTDLRPGSAFKYLSRNGKYCFVRGTILEVDPPRRLVHTYQFTFRQDSPSRVTWELEQISSDEVRVRLTHDQFDGPTTTYQGVKDGWSKILQSLKSWIETGDIALSTKLFYLFFRLQLPLLPKECRER